MLALGQRAGIAETHPRCFTDSFAVDMLVRAISPHDVATLLGDTVETAERHYAPAVDRRTVITSLRGGSKNLPTFASPLCVLICDQSPGWVDIFLKKAEAGRGTRRRSPGPYPSAGRLNYCL